MATQDPPSRSKVTAIVTTFNEERHVAACLDALLWCDEILVVDSHSTDATVEVVRAYAERHPDLKLHQRTYYGAAAQKNWAMQQVAHDWILIFDADERCTPALRREIEGLLTRGPAEDAYTIRRRVFFLGRVIRFSGWQHDEVVRLVKRGTARYPDRRVHADMETSGPAPRLRHTMDHHMVDDFHAYALRIAKYARWGAAQAWKEGRRAGVLEIAFRPAWRFFRTYAVQLGVLDGLRGLVFCALQAYGTYLKWALLWSWRVNARRGLEPDLPAFESRAASGSTPSSD